MKKIFYFLLLLSISSFIFAERVTLKTGESLSLSIVDYFFPIDMNVIGCRCSISSIHKIENDIWCFTILALKNNSSILPIKYDYYIRKDSILRFNRLNTSMSECSLKVVSIDWNIITLEIL